MFYFASPSSFFSLLSKYLSYVYTSEKQLSFSLDLGEDEVQKIDLYGFVFVLFFYKRKVTIFIFFPELFDSLLKGHYFTILRQIGSTKQEVYCSGMRAREFTV